MIKSFLKVFIFILSFNSYSHTLVVTDSHGEGSFGDELVRLIESKKESVSFYAVGGSTPKDWILGLNQIWGYWEYHTGKKPIRYERPTTPRLKELLSKHSPERVIIELGTNLIWRPISEEDINFIEEMVGLIAEINSECIWIGPPDLKPNYIEHKKRTFEVHRILEEKLLVSHCKLVPSWKFTNFPKNQGDGIHYDSIPFLGEKLARSWAKEAFNY